MTTQADPFEGLPPHMIESIPVMVDVTIERPGLRAPDAQGSIALDPGMKHETVTIPLERDGRPLTMADRRGWAAGEREGWRAWPVRDGATHEEWHDIEAEELHG